MISKILLIRLRKILAIPVKIETSKLSIISGMISVNKINLKGINNKFPKSLILPTLFFSIILLNETNKVDINRRINVQLDKIIILVLY